MVGVVLALVVFLVVVVVVVLDGVAVCDLSLARLKLSSFQQTKKHRSYIEEVVSKLEAQIDTGEAGPYDSTPA